MRGMDRFPLFLSFLTATILLLTGQAGKAGQIGDVPPPSPQAHQNVNPIPFRGNGAPAPTVSTEAELIQDLITIMNETKSPGTLMATVMALVPMGKTAQPAIPAIIRNAGRMKLLDDKKNSKPWTSEFAQTIMSAIVEIQKDKYGGCFINFYQADKTERMDVLLKDSEDLRQLQGEWRRFWMNDQPSHMTPQRVHGAIGPGADDEYATPTSLDAGSIGSIGFVAGVLEKIAKDVAQLYTAQPSGQMVDWLLGWPQPQRPMTYQRVHGGIGPGGEN
jgi:hypothetical protein